MGAAACRALSTRARPRATAPALAAARATGWRALSTRSQQSLTSHRGGVHGNVGHVSKVWRNKPLFRREGNWHFKTGKEASEMLVQEAKRRDEFKLEYLERITSVLGSLAPVFDRMPKYAWIAKLLLEPERQLQFRVAWLDDSGNTRVNRGVRVQYSSALGPYEGPLHFHPIVDSSFVKALPRARARARVPRGAVARAVWRARRGARRRALSPPRARRARSTRRSATGSAARARRSAARTLTLRTSPRPRSSASVRAT